MSTTKQAIAQLIADTIKSVTSYSITDKGSALEISSSSGTTKLPIRNSKTTTRSTSTFR